MNERASGQTQWAATAPCVVVRDSTGSRHTFYRGQTIPAWLPAAELERLEAEGMVSRAERPAPVVDSRGRQLRDLAAIDGTHDDDTDSL